MVRLKFATLHEMSSLYLQTWSFLPRLSETASTDYTGFNAATNNG